MSEKKYRKFDGFTTNAWRRPEDKGGGGTIEEIQRNGVPLPIEDKTVNIEVPEKTSELQNDGESGSPFATKEYVDQNTGSITAIKRNGSLLPITDKTVDVVVPTKTSELVNDSDFIPLGDAATLSVFKIPGGDGGEETTTVIEEEPNKLSFNYYKNAQGKLSDSVNMTFGDEDYFSLATTDYVNQGLAEKQDKLESGINVKTINNQSILGSGNIDVGGGGSGNYLETDGGTMYGNIEMDGNLIRTLGMPEDDGDAATKRYVDECVGDANNFFIATHGVTTISELREAFNANKKIMCFVPKLSGGSDYGVLLLCDNHEPSDGYFNFVGLVGPSSIATTAIQEDIPWSTPHISRIAPLNTPNFTGVPKAPTAAEGTANTQIATTEFVNRAIANADKIFIFDTANTPTFNEFKAIVDGGEKTVIVKHEGKFYAPYSYTYNEYEGEPELPVEVAIIFTTGDNTRTFVGYQNAKSEKDLPLTQTATERRVVAASMQSNYSPNGSVSARFEQNAYRLDLNNYNEGRLRHTFYNQAGLSKTVDVSLFPEYEICVNDVGGNVVQIGTIKEGTEQKNLYQFYYRTDDLPAAEGTVVYNFTNLLANYTINDFIDATGITSNGIFIGNGRTDNSNRLIVQQFSKNNKTITIRAYQSFAGNTALLKVIFIGKKGS